MCRYSGAGISIFLLTQVLFDPLLLKQCIHWIHQLYQKNTYLNTIQLLQFRYIFSHVTEILLRLPTDMVSPSDHKCNCMKQHQGVEIPLFHPVSPKFQVVSGGFISISPCFMLFHLNFRWFHLSFTQFHFIYLISVNLF